MSIFTVLSTASLPVSLITLCLVAMSIYSWGYSAFRYKVIKKEQTNLFAISQRLEDSIPIETVGDLENSIFKEAASSSGGEKFFALFTYIANNKNSTSSHSGKYKNKVNLLRKTHLTHYRNYVTKGISHIAVITYLAPYVGLLGTVLGILDVFQKMGSLSVVTLDVIAVPISEALFITALGLCVAIPAYALHTLLRNQSKAAFEMLDKSLDTLVIFKVGGENQ